MEHSGVSRSGFWAPFRKLHPGLVRPFRRALREGAIFALLAIINPFEIISWSDQRSHELWEKMAAHDYPARGGNTRTSVGGPARDDISLVYFDDASVQRQFGDKPLDSFGLLDLIDDIRLTGADPTKSDIENAPAAILVDMTLDDAAPEGVAADTLLDAVQPSDAKHLEAERCEARSPEAKPALSPFQCLVIRVAQLTKYHIWQNDLQCFQNTLAKLRCIHAAHGLPLIFVDPKMPMEGEKRTSFPESTVAHTVLDRIAVLSPATIDVYNYPLVTPADPNDRWNRPFFLYPAAALYAAWCISHRCQGLSVSEPATDWPSGFNEPVNVAWGIRPPNVPPIAPPLGEQRVYDEANRKDPSRLTVALAGANCTAAQPGLFGTLTRMARMVFAALLKDPARCPYVRAFPSDIFQSASFSPDDHRKISTGKLVIIGGDFLGSSDRVPTAPFDSLAGVYLHAMVLDNLIEFGAEYPKPPVPVLGGFNRYDFLNVMIVMIVALVIGTAKARLKRIGTEEPKHALWWRVAERLVVALSAALLLLLAYWLITGNTAIIPQNVNLVAATLFAGFGLLELFGDTLEPILQEIGARFARAESILLRGQDLSNDVED